MWYYKTKSILYRVGDRRYTIGKIDISAPKMEVICGVFNCLFLYCSLTCSVSYHSKLEEHWQYRKQSRTNKDTKW